MKSRELQVPLSQSQINAACRLGAELPQWRLSDAAVEMLAKAMPGFSAQECLVKSAAVNAIYGTNVLALVRMAHWVTTQMRRTKQHDAALVDEIAKLPKVEGEKIAYRTSFASKFCHFFVEAEEFPIYDDAARQAVDHHLGKEKTPSGSRRYRSFCERFNFLRDNAQLSCSTRDLDRYLWLTGMFMRYARWRTKKKRSKSGPKVNAELRELFDAQWTGDKARLRAFLPDKIALMMRKRAVPRGKGRR